MTSQRRLALARILALLVVIALTAFAFSQRDRASEWAAYGYPGIFLITLLANATVILPAPSLVIPFSMGAVLHPAGVALAAALGATAGELTGYLAGFSGQAMVEDTEIYQRLLPWMRSRYSYLTLLVLAILPLPVFDVAGLIAGMLNMPLPAFLGITFCGKLIKMLAVTYLGASTLGKLWH